MSKYRLTLRILARDVFIVIGIVLIWRGVWQLLDILEEMFFINGTIWTAVGGIIVGLIILYIPDKDLKELENL